MEEALRAVLEADARIAYALIFGSVGRGSGHARSDLDVAVGLRSGAALDALAVGDLISRLEAAAGRPVDLVLLDKAPPTVAYRVFRDGRVILERDRAAFVERKARAILDYLDFKPVEDACSRGVLAAAKRG
jgi:predicted nucleotidyltransferase